MSSWKAIGALLAAAALFTSAVVFLPSSPADQAFVAYRYAENLADGHGFVYNAGDEPAEGFDSVLWVVICAQVHRLGFALPSAGPRLSIVFAMGCVLLVWLTLRRWASRTRDLVLPMILVGTCTPLAVAAVSGTSVALFSALVVAALFAGDRARAAPSLANYLLLAVIGFLICVCRVEGIVVFPAIVVSLIYGRDADRRRSPRVEVIGVAVWLVAVVVYHAWRINNFGALAPPGLGRRTAAGIGAYFVRQPQDLPAFGYYYLFVGILGVVGHWKSRPQTLAALVVGAVLFFVSVLFGDALPALGGQAPAAIALILPSVRATESLMARRDTRVETRRGAAAALFVALVTLGGYWYADARIGVGRVSARQTKVLPDLGRWIADWQPGAAIATDAPGALEYYAGLTAVELREQPTVASVDFTRATLEHADIVILSATGGLEPKLDAFQRRVIGSKKFDQRYRLLAATRTEWYDDPIRLIYVDRDIPQLTDEARDGVPDGIGHLVLNH